MRYLLIVYMLVVFQNMFRKRIDKYLMVTHVGLEAIGGVMSKVQTLRWHWHV